MSQPHFNPKVLILYSDYRYSEILGFQDAMSGLMDGKIQAMDSNFTVYDLSGWGSSNPHSGWCRWLSFSEAKYDEVQSGRDMTGEWEFFRLSSGVQFVVPHICVYKNKQTKSGKFSGKPASIAVFLRDRFCCIYCGREVMKKRSNAGGERDSATIDHFIPTARWDAWARKNKPKFKSDSWENLGTSCYPCNHKKGDALNGEAGLVPLVIPFAPRWKLHKSIHLKRSQIKSRWNQYLYPEK